MTNREELRALIRRAEDAGAQIVVLYDFWAAADEGRAVISDVRVLKTTHPAFRDIGPGWMSNIAAAKRLREAVAKLPA